MVLIGGGYRGREIERGRHGERKKEMGEEEREREGTQENLFLGLSLFHKEHEHTACLRCTIHF